MSNGENADTNKTFSVVMRFESEEELFCVMGNGCTFVVCGMNELVTHIETQFASVEIHTPKFAGNLSAWRPCDGASSVVEEPLKRTKWDAAAPALDPLDVSHLFSQYRTVWLLRGAGGFWLRGWDERWPCSWQDGQQWWRELVVVGAVGPRAQGDGWLHDAGTDASEAKSSQRLPLLDLSEVLEFGVGIREPGEGAELEVSTSVGSSNWLLRCGARQWRSWRNAADLGTVGSIALVRFPLALVLQLSGLLGWARGDKLRADVLSCAVGLRGRGLVRVVSAAVRQGPCAGTGRGRAVDILLAI